MKNIILLLVIILSSTLNLSAQKKDKDLKKLFEIMQIEKITGEMMNNMLPFIKKQASQKLKGKGQQKKFDTYMTYVAKETTNLSLKLVNVEMLKIYDTHFSHKEVKKLIKFYKSSTGKKMIEKTPQITKDLMSSLPKYLPEFQKNLKEKLEELKNKDI